MEKENRVELDLKIIRKKHELKNIKLKTQYIITKEYHITLNILKELLNKQKSIDKENFLNNLMSIDEFKNEVLKRKKKKALFNKLSKVEQDFIIQNEYDYLNDKLNLLTNNISPNCKLVYDWNNLKIDIFNKNN
jgi:hypothetical protein